MPMRLTWPLPAALAAALLPAVPAAAQQAQDVTFFRQFLVSDDPLGTGIIWLLLVMSFLSTAFATSLFLRYRRGSMLPEPVQQRVADLIRQKKYREAIDVADQDSSYLGRIISGALAEAGAGYDAMERAIQETGDAETARILRPLEYLNVLGNIAPMLGLFGTVYGMIVAFQQLVASGGNPDPALLAAGISTALVTTFWGLVVAMPALASYALIRNRVDALTSDGILLGEQLISPFKPRRERERDKDREKDGERDDRSSGRRSRATPKITGSGLNDRADRPDKPG